MHTTTIDYQQIQQRLSRAGVDCSPSWLHGALFGLIALHDDRHAAPCEGLSQVLDGLDAMQEEVHALYLDIWQALDGPGLDFDMLLPPRSRPLIERAEGVNDWIRGYLQGLQCGGIDSLEFPVASGRQALEELQDLGNTPAAEMAENEEELHEAMEHAWVTAVLVRELLVVARERIND